MHYYNFDDLYHTASLPSNNDSIFSDDELYNYVCSSEHARSTIVWHDA